MNRPRYIIIFIALTVGALTVLQVSVGNQISTAGDELSKLQKQVNDFERENIILQEQILDAQSYTNISEKAAKLGYAKIKSEIVLKSSVPLAMKR